MTINIEDQTKSLAIGTHWSSIEGKPLQAAVQLPRRIVVRSIDCNSGDYVPLHSHAWGQLLFLTEGLVETRAKDSGTWIVPPQRALWLPPYVEHEIKVIHSVKMRNVYIAPTTGQHLPTSCQVMNVSPLLRELIISLVDLPPLYDEEGADGRLVDVFFDQLHLSKEAPLHLPMPSSKALLIIAKTILEHPSQHYSMNHWEQKLGLSSRTLARRFTAETAMTYSQWRQQAKLFHALQRIALGEAVANIALELGYQSQSAFISMFKKALGKTPGKYFSDT